MKKHDRYPLLAKIKYLLNSFVSKGLWAQVLLLVAVSVNLTLLFGLVVKKLGQPDYGEAYWAALMHMLDQGTITADEAGTDGYFMFMLLVTFVGMAFTGTTVAIITAAIQGKLENLNKGHSPVIERNHVVILGFDGNTGTICREILETGRLRGERIPVVVADDLPKEAMEQDLKEYQGTPLMPDRQEKRNGRLKVIIRSGDLVSENTFSVCNLERARAVLICRSNDLETIRILLALSAYLKKKGACIEDEEMPEIIALIHDESNIPAANYAAGLKVRIMNDMEIMGRYFAQTCVQQGFPYVLDGLFNPVKTSIFIERKNDSARFLGKTLPEISAVVKNAIPLGFIREKEGRPESIILNPLKTARYQATDRLVYLADGPDMIIGERGAVEPAGRLLVTEDTNKNRRNILVAGWSNALPGMLGNLGAYCTEGSGVTVADRENRIPEGSRIPCSSVPCADPCSWKELKEIMDSNPFWFEDGDERRLTNIVVFPPEDDSGTGADEKVMALVLNIRRYLEERGISDISVTSEVQLPQNQMLLINRKSNDFVVASEISNHMMTQLLDNPAKYCIINNLIRPESDIIQLNPLTDYVDTGAEFNFEGVFRAAVARGDATGRAEIPLGWIVLTGEESSALVLNPGIEELARIYPAGDYSSYRLIALSGIGYFIPGHED